MSAAATPEQILDAAVEQASLHGLRRLSVGDVATAAGVSRPTLYKHFPSKDALITAAVARETSSVAASVLAAAEAHDDPADALEAAVAETLRLARAHPLLDRIIRTEPDTLLPVLTADGGPVVTMVRTPIETTMAARLPHLDELPRRRLADIICRLLISYAISPPDDPPEVVAAAVAHFLVEGASSLDPFTIHPSA
ncbi:MAG: TetR family transcriptional regulator [Acidimicrobiia bacterium]|nr:TetR family transcriptional regulator [Acidimicrobiia bacterium]